MWNFILNNLGTIIVGAVLILAVVLAVLSIMRHKKKGITSCGGECSACAFSAECRKRKQ